MTSAIKNKIAGQKFDKNTYKDIFKQADDVFAANGGVSSSSPAVVAATSVSSASTPDTSASSSSSTPQVSAVRGQSNRGGRGQYRGRGNRGGRGTYNNSNNRQNQNNQNQQNQTQQQGQKPHQRGPKASPDVPDDACARHWKEGRSATYCSDPLVCSWVKNVVPRTPRT